MDKKSESLKKLVVLVLFMLFDISAQAQHVVSDSGIMILPKISIEGLKDHDLRLERKPLKILLQESALQLPEIAVLPLPGSMPPPPRQKVPQKSMLSKGRLMAGLSHNAYRGDLGDGYHAGGLAVHLSYMFAHERRLHGGLHAAAGNFSGHELVAGVPDFNVEAQRNTYFATSFFSMHYSLQLDLIRRKNVLVYLSQGLGIMRFVPKDEFGTPLLDALGTRADNESYSNAAAILPTQAGVDFLMPNSLGVGVKLGWLNTTSDYLDNISQLDDQAGNDNILQLLLQLYVPL
jgi:hypothetical protein